MPIIPFELPKKDPPRCCVCKAGHSPAVRCQFYDEIELDGHKIHVDLEALPVSEDETKYICHHCGLRAIEMAYKNMMEDMKGMQR